jgi:anthranilate phosphoribosyltransferase
VHKFGACAKSSICSGIVFVHPTGYHSSLRAIEPRKRWLGRRSPVNLLAYALLSSPATASADPSVVIQSGKSIGCL